MNWVSKRRPDNCAGSCNGAGGRVEGRRRRRRHRRT